MPGRPEWLSLEPMNPNRKRSGVAPPGFSSDMMYCTELRGRMLNAGWKQSRHWPASCQSASFVPGTVAAPPLYFAST